MSRVDDGFYVEDLETRYRVYQIGPQYLCRLLVHLCGDHVGQAVE